MRDLSSSYSDFQSSKQWTVVGFGFLASMDIYSEASPAAKELTLIKQRPPGFCREGAQECLVLVSFLHWLLSILNISPGCWFLENILALSVPQHLLIFCDPLSVLFATPLLLWKDKVPNFISKHKSTV